MKLNRGAVVWVDLNPTQGHEQRGMRPCVLVSDSSVETHQRFPLLCVVPVTGTESPGPLYPPLAAGPSGLTKRSYALVDQLRSIDKLRVKRVFGRVSSRELEAIDDGLRHYLGLHPAP